MANNPNARANLRPAKKGEVRNPNGRPVGSRSLSTIIKDLLEDGNLNWKLVPIKNNAEFGKQFGKRGWDAITYVAIAKAMSGDHSAREWLRKSQYGDKVDVTSMGKALPTPILGGELAIRSDNSDAQDSPDQQTS